MSAAYWVVALLVFLPAAEATPTCNTWSVGEVSDPAGDAPAGADIIRVAWGVPDPRPGEYDRPTVLVETHGPVHSDLRWNVAIWSGYGNDTYEANGMHCIEWAHGAPQAEVRWAHESSVRTGDEPSRPYVRTCADHTSLQFTPTIVNHTLYLGSAHGVPGSTADRFPRACTVAVASVWDGDELVEQVGSIPSGVPAASTCPVPIATDTDCGRFIPSSPWPLAGLAIVAAIWLARRRVQ